MKKDDNFIIKKEDTYFIVEKSFLQNISHTEANFLIESTLEELHKTLVDEAISHKILFVGRQRLIDGLNNTLEYLISNYPEFFKEKLNSN